MKASTVATTSIGTITATGVQSAIAVGSATDINLNLVASSVTSGATFRIEGRRSSRDGAGPYVPLREFSITADGTYSIPVLKDKQAIIRKAGSSIEQWRVNCVALTDGSFVATRTDVTD